MGCQSNNQAENVIIGNRDEVGNRTDPSDEDGIGTIVQ